MAEILGKYIIRASLADFTAGFAFANAGQNQTLTIASDTLLTCTCTDRIKPISNNEVSFVKNNILKIRGIRILTTGAEGLRAGIGKPAASLLFVGYGQKDTTDPEGTFQVIVDRFNEWNDVNINFLVAKTAPNDNFYLGLEHTYSSLNLEDYNIQADYIGMSFTPFLELSIDTAGILDNSGDLI